jgi:hypothetical protein
VRTHPTLAIAACLYSCAGVQQHFHPATASCRCGRVDIVKTQPTATFFTTNLCHSIVPLWPCCLYVATSLNTCQGTSACSRFDAQPGLAGTELRCKLPSTVDACIH